MRRTPRIDAHHHLWRYTAAEYGWIGEEMRALRRDFVLDDLRGAMTAAGVDGTIAVQARQTVEETRWLLGLGREASPTGDPSPVWGVVGWLPIADAGFPAVLDAMKDEPLLCGLRHVVQGEEPGFLDREDFNRGIAAMRGLGLVYDVLIYARQIGEATRFVDRHPAQPFVLDHIAKPAMRENGGFEAWRGEFAELGRREHVSCKLSGMITETDWTRWTAAELEPYFETALEAFGPERLMIGTDWPVLTVGASYAAWWRTVEGWIAKLSETERASILGGTAQRVYRLREQGLQE